MNVKICSTCKQVKKITEFYKNKSTKDGLATACKICSYKRSKAWIQTPRGKILMQRLHKNRRLKLKKQIFEILGDKCQKCGFEDWRALQIDHINGGGNKQRKLQSWSPFYIAIISGKIPPSEVQILCANCNSIKIYENKERASKYE